MTMTFTAPTVKTLERLHWLSDEQRRELRALMKQRIIVLRGDPAVFAVMDRMQELSQIAGTHGAERLYTRKHVYYYLNTGDTYDTTIIVHPSSRRFFVCDWGTLVEQEGTG